MADNPETPENTGRRGPPRQKLGRRSRSRFLRLLRQGYGITLARDKLGISRRCLRNTEQAHPSFRRGMVDAIAAARQDLELLAYQLAKSKDPKFLEVALGRIDKSRQLAQSAREHREKMAAIYQNIDRYASQVGLGSLNAILTALIDLIPPENRPALQARIEQYRREALLRENGGAMPESELTPGERFYRNQNQQDGRLEPARPQVSETDKFRQEQERYYRHPPPEPEP